VLLLRRLALTLAVLSVMLWLASYSWLLGLTPPTRWLSPGASPWLVVEVAAAGAGALSLVAGLLTSRLSRGEASRSGRLAASLGGFAMGMSLLSVALPA
jgi:hypothetical protein